MTNKISKFKSVNSNMRVFDAINKENKRRYLIKKKRIKKFLQIQYNNRIQSSQKSMLDYMKIVIESICMDISNNYDDFIYPHKLDEFRIKIRNIVDNINA